MKRLSKSKVLAILKLCYPYVFNCQRLSNITDFVYHKGDFEIKPCYEIEFSGGLAAQLCVLGNELEIQPFCNTVEGCPPYDWSAFCDSFIYSLEV